MAKTEADKTFERIMKRIRTIRLKKVRAAAAQLAAEESRQQARFAVRNVRRKKKRS